MVMKQIRDSKYHGFTGAKLYNSWRAMKQRCYDKSQYSKSYQGKKIQVFKGWHRFVDFKEWALNNGYKEGLTIERVDSSRDYEPSNCKWLTRSENISNRNKEYDYSKRKKLRYILMENGLKIGVKEYSELNKLVYNTFRSTLNGMGSLINESDINKNLLN